MTTTRTRISKGARRTIDELRANRGADGAAIISSRQTAVLIRDRLKREFPGTRFSVRKDGADCVRISWEDGPTQSRVDAITSTYSFGGFDGMIDMDYGSMNWIKPNGTLSHAGTDGTGGSRGSVPSSYTDCPEPGAFLVKWGPKYIFTDREISESRWSVILRGASEYYGFPYDPDGTRTGLKRWEQRHLGEYVTTLAMKWEAATEQG